MNEDRLKEIEKERKSLCRRLEELDDEVYGLENSVDLGIANAAIGKYYWNKNGGVGNNAVFHPKKVSNKPPLKVMLNGEYAVETMYLIGDINVYVSNNYPINIDIFKRDYEEITKEEYEKKRNGMLKFFMKD